MGLEKVKEEILEHGRAEEARLLAEGQGEAKAILKDARSKTRTILDRALERAREQIKRHQVQEMSIAHVEVKKTRLNAEKEMLDKVYSECIVQMRALPPESVRQMLDAHLTNAKKEFGSQKAYVVCNERDEKMVRLLCEKYGFEFQGVVECIGGVVVENQDRTIRLDYRWETLLGDIWSRKIKDISDILFG
jgi:V/A-type H+-transporting ATPase subunit E